MRTPLFLMMAVLTAVVAAGLGYRLLSTSSSTGEGVQEQLSRLEVRVAGDPASPAKHYELALACRKAGLGSRALAELDKVISLAPDYVSAHVAAAEIRYEQGSYDRAARDAEQALCRQPQSVEAQAVYAAALGVSGEYRQCIIALEHLAFGSPSPQETPEYRPPYPASAAWLQLDVSQDRHGLFARKPDVLLADARRIGRLIDVYEGRLDRARKLLRGEDTNKKQPDQLAAIEAALREALICQITLAWAYLRAGEPDTARALVDEMSDCVFPEFRQVTQAHVLGVLLRAKLLQMNGRHEDALKILEQCRDGVLKVPAPSRPNAPDFRRTDPRAHEYAVIRGAIADIFDLLGRPDKAIAQLEEALEYAPNDFQILLPLANAYLLLAVKPAKEKQSFAIDLLDNLKRDLLDVQFDTRDEILKNVDRVRAVLRSPKPGSGQVHSRMIPLEKATQSLERSGSLDDLRKARFAPQLNTVRLLVASREYAIDHATKTADRLLERHIDSPSRRMILAMAKLERYRDDIRAADELARRAHSIGRMVRPYHAAAEDADRQEWESRGIKKRAKLEGRSITTELNNEMQKLALAAKAKEERAMAEAIAKLRRLYPKQAEAAGKLLAGDELEQAGRVFTAIQHDLRSDSTRLRNQALNTRRHAHVELMRLVMEWPDFQPAYYVAVDLLAAGNAAEAAGILDGATASGERSQHLRNWVGLAVALIVDGRGDEALLAISRARGIAALDRNELLHELHLLALIGASRPERAKALCSTEGRLPAGIRTAYLELARQPRHAAAAAALGIGRGMLCMLYGEHEAARDEFDAARDVLVTSPLPELWNARSMLHAGDVERAVAAARALCEKEKQLAAAWIALGDAQMAAKDPKAAVEAYQKAAEIEANWAPCHAKLAGALLDVGKTGQARREYKIAVDDCGSSDPRTLAELALLLARENKADRSAELAEKASAAEPTNPRVILARGASLFAQGHLENSLEQLEAAAAGDINSAEARWFLGRCLRKLGKPARAQRAFKAANQLDPNGPFGREPTSP